MFNKFNFSISSALWQCDFKNNTISIWWSERESIKLSRFLSTTRRASEWDELLSNNIIRRLQQKKIDQLSKKFLKDWNYISVAALIDSRR